MIQKNYKIIDLEWDTEYFCMNCAKLLLNDYIQNEAWAEIENEIKNYHLITVYNMNSNIYNSMNITKYLKGYLVDVNIRFDKTVNTFDNYNQEHMIYLDKITDITIQKEIINITNFGFSRFAKDPILKDKNGSKIYNIWLNYAFRDASKEFILSYNSEGVLTGYILFAIYGTTCNIELLAVSQFYQGSGYGGMLISKLEKLAKLRGVTLLTVGTQVSNRGAINFYHSKGFKQISENEIYHVWPRFKEVF